MQTPRIALIALASALAGAVLGWIGARAWTPAAGDRSASVPVPHAAAPTAHGRVEPRIAASAGHVIDDDLGRAVARARSEPAYLRELLRRYGAETDLDRKSALLAILGTLGGDEVLRFALQQSASTDPAVRGDGLRLLASFPMDRAEVRGAIVGQLGAERDPKLTVQLVDMLAPTQLPVEDAAPVVRELARLRTHADPDVRAASVLQSAQWDRGGDVEDVLQRAILDPAPQVRAAAIAGITSSRTRSDRLKDALLDIASNPASNSEERSAAVVALQDFALDRGEYALYREAADATAHD